MAHKSFIALAFLLTASLFACRNQGSTSKDLDTPTTGHIPIMADEGYKSILASSIDVFDSIYRRASINAIYTSEGDAVHALLDPDDSIEVVIITRRLTEEELNKYFRPRGFEPKTTPIAYDAVAFIQNPTNTDTTLTVQQIRDIISGKITKWNQINPNSKLGAIQVVFDNPLSGTVRYAKDSIAGAASLPPAASALKTNEEVINYVAKNKNALGIISANVISDTDSEGVQSFLKEIRLCRIAKEPGHRGYGPYQAYLYTNDYPFKRTVYIINAQARSGLGLGIASFLAGPAGQTIVLKDGLLPAQAVTRLMEFRR